MGKPYYLIDFENVRPALDRLPPGQCHVLVFTGETTKRIDVDLAFALPRFGADIQRVAISGTGSNALDFHIAFYIGHIAAREPGASFVIVSKDTGFDPLIRHLKDKGIACRRIADIPAAAGTAPATKAPPVAKKSKAMTVVVLPEPNGAAAEPVNALADERASKIVRCLKKAKRPTKTSTLATFIGATFQPAKLDAAAIKAVIASLQKAGKVAIAGTKVTYKLG
ncbi:hypothetical protein GCM10008101_16770 [Lysobacter xinjiangensis]|uniref:PIN-like domain-containing protein n=1 Tax=Cognatilysobacter xinjiangensis TaxID=546892 RepID=A0ABQ3C6I4_9GAMM|nr:PIN domain-containing protein [Lysobacter xinjiangensis]GGZ63870.1 hypothetical protein GCM10008101_16770 [Lysobacter xinjiangensis]